MSLFLLLSTKDDILENVGKQTLVPIDFHGREDETYRSQWGPATVWIPTFFKLSYSMFNRRKEQQVNDDRITFLCELSL